MTLDDLESPDPDWPLILVYSDYLEDAGNILHAEALRWLYKYNHWPQGSELSYYEKDAVWIWYFLTSYNKDEIKTSYYNRSTKKEATNSSNLYIIWRRATLPPEFNEKYSAREVAFSSIMNLYLDLFSTHIKTSTFAPKLLPHFMRTLPRSLEDIHLCKPQPQP